MSDTQPQMREREFVQVLVPQGPEFHWNNNSEFACVAVGKRVSLNPSPEAAAERALLSPRVSSVGESETM